MLYITPTFGYDLYTAPSHIHRTIRARPAAILAHTRKEYTSQRGRGISRARLADAAQSSSGITHTNTHNTSVWGEGGVVWCALV